LLAKRRKLTRKRRSKLAGDVSYDNFTVVCYAQQVMYISLYQS